MFASQSNTQVGHKPFIAASDLTGKEGLLVVLANSSNVAVVGLVAALTDIPLHVLVDGAAAGLPVECQPLTTNENMRIRLKSTCVAGDVLVLADPATPADAGKVRKLPATPGLYVSVGQAEETGADGQLVLVRPHLRLIHVKSADSLTALTFTAGGATGPEVGALRDAVKALLEAQGLMA